MACAPQAAKILPCYAVVLTLLGAMVAAAARGEMAWPAKNFPLARPMFVAPQFSVAAIVSLAWLLFAVTTARPRLSRFW